MSYSASQGTALSNWPLERSQAPVFPLWAAKYTKVVKVSYNSAFLRSTKQTLDGIYIRPLKIPGSVRTNAACKSRLTLP